MTAADVTPTPLVRTKRFAQGAELSPLPVPTWAHHLLELEKVALGMRSPQLGGLFRRKYLGWAASLSPGN